MGQELSAFIEGTCVSLGEGTSLACAHLDSDCLPSVTRATPGHGDLPGPVLPSALHALRLGRLTALSLAAPPCGALGEQAAQSRRAMSHRNAQ